MKDARVFVAATDERMRRLLSAVLQSVLDDAVVLARGASVAAFRELKSFRPHLILLDLCGVESRQCVALIEQLRRVDGGRSARLLVITDSVDVSRTERLLTSDVDGVILSNETDARLLQARCREGGRNVPSVNAPEGEALASLESAS